MVGIMRKIEQDKTVDITTNLFSIKKTEIRTEFIA